MPQASERLRKKFLTKDNDGIGECIDIIVNADGSVSKDFIITPPIDENLTDEVWDAIEYLITEWDYGLSTQDEAINL